jgi:hypothetical protein
LGFMGRAFLTGFRRVFPEIGKAFGEGLRILPTRLGLVVLNVQEKAAAMMRKLAGAISRGIGGVVAKIGELIARMLKPWVNANVWLVDKGIALLRGLGRGIGSGVSGVLDRVSSIPGRILKALGSLGSILYNAGKELIQGLINGIMSKLKDLAGAMGKVASKIKGFLPGSPVKEGPLRSWNNGGAGKRLVRLLASGLKDTRPVDLAMARLSGNLSTTGSLSVAAGVAAAGAPGSAVVGSSAHPASVASAGAQSVTVNLHFHGLVTDPVGVGKQLEKVLIEYKHAKGNKSLGFV